MSRRPLGRRMRTVTVLVAAALAAAMVDPPSSRAQGTPAATASERMDKGAVRQAFATWEAGGTRFFDILDDSVVWSILGAGPHARTYRGKAAFLEGAVAPVAARLSVPLRPTLRSIHADGDDVVTLWDGVAQTRDGRTYRNTYAWFFTMRDGRVVQASALLDLEAYRDLVARVPAAPRP